MNRPCLSDCGQRAETAIPAAQGRCLIWMSRYDRESGWDVKVVLQRRWGPHARAGLAGLAAGVAEDAAEAQVAGGGVDRLGLAGRWAVTQAVVGSAQVGSALGHTARDLRAGLTGRQACLRRRDARVARRAARALNLPAPAGDEVVAGPLPDVPGHVVQPVTVGREALDRGCPLPAVGLEVLPGKLTLPGIGQ